MRIAAILGSALLLLASCRASNDAQTPAAEPAMEREEASLPAASSDLWAPPASNREHLADSLPKKDDMTIPPYPGARAIAISPAHGEILSRLGAYAPDSPEAVFAFYRERLDDWEDNGSNTIWKGEAADRIKAGGYMIPTIEILPPSEAEKSVWPEAKAMMTIAF